MDINKNHGEGMDWLWVGGVKRKLISLKFANQWH